MLLAKEDAGEIFELHRQVPFELIPPQKVDGKVIRGVKYIADFTYRTPEGELIVEDSKGYRTEVYRIKKKLMLHVHGILVLEV